MKDHRQLLKSLDPAHTQFIQHEWGQSVPRVYNALVTIWNDMPIGDCVIITTHKHFGAKKLLDFLEARRLQPAVIGKGPDNLRVIRCIKQSDKTLEPVQSTPPVDFDFQGTAFHAEVGEAVFSRTGLDEGTRFLLESFLEKIPTLDGKKVADFGCGWGAISLILAQRFPNCQIWAFDKDDAACRAAAQNLEKYPQAQVKALDLATPVDDQYRKETGRFDFVLSNPPFHAAEKDKRIFFQNADTLLKKNGELCLVVEKSFQSRFDAITAHYFTERKQLEHGKYIVSWYRKRPPQIAADDRPEDDMRRVTEVIRSTGFYRQPK